MTDDASKAEERKLGKGSKLPGPRISLHYSNFLNALAEEHDIVFEETTPFLKHARMKHGEKRELRCD